MQGMRIGSVVLPGYSFGHDFGRRRYLILSLDVIPISIDTSKYQYTRFKFNTPALPSPPFPQHSISINAKTTQFFPLCFTAGGFFLLPGWALL